MVCRDFDSVVEVCTKVLQSLLCGYGTVFVSGSGGTWKFGSVGDGWGRQKAKKGSKTPKNRVKVTRKLGIEGDRIGVSAQ